MRSAHASGCRDEDDGRAYTIWPQRLEQLGRRPGNGPLPSDRKKNVDFREIALKIDFGLP